MPEPIKMTAEELGAIQDIQGKFQSKILEFGHLYFEKMQVDEAIKIITAKEVQLQEELKSLQNTEKELIEKLLKTYGEGQLNIKDGTFVPDK